MLFILERLRGLRMASNHGVLLLLSCAWIAAPQRAFGEPIPEKNHLIISTKTGLVEGVIETTLLGKEVTSFYGIPYAKPPLGELRFTPPVAVEPWAEVLSAKTIPSPCYQQYNRDQRHRLKNSNQLLPRPWSEDCLKLNLWVANLTDPEQLVIVYLHGGDFSFGSGPSNTFMDLSYAAETKIVLATVNYRLGAFGFMFTSHPEAPGNVGLWDQRLALKWIKENVEVFGGNHRSIFLKGDVSGAACAGFHVISKASAGLFARVALLQGAPNCNWAYDDPDHAIAKTSSLADQLGCKTDNKTAMIGCLRSKDPEDVVSVAVSQNLQFRPSLDGTFLIEPPRAALRSGRVNNVNHVVITASDQGSLEFLNANSDILMTQDGRLNRFNFRRVLKRLIPDINASMVGAVKNQYLDWSKPEDPIMLRNAAREIYAEYLTDCCANEYTHQLARSNYTVVRGVFNIEMKKPRQWMGVVSTAQGECFRGHPLLGQKLGYTKVQEHFCRLHLSWLQRAFRKRFVDMLATFTKYDAEKKIYFLIGKQMKSHTDLKLQRRLFWEKLIP